MLGKTHDVFAFASLATAAVYFRPDNPGIIGIIVILIANIIGATLPDIDQASNRLWDMIPGGEIFGKLIKNLFLSHRGISHSLLGIFLIYKLANWLLPKIFNSNFVDTDLVVTSLMIGYLSHLFLDLLTEEGLPLLWPIKWRAGIPPVRSWRIKTGRWFEKWVVFPAIIGYIIVLGAVEWLGRG